MNNNYCIKHTFWNTNKIITNITFQSMFEKQVSLYENTTDKVYSLIESPGTMITICLIECLIVQGTQILCFFSRLVCRIEECLIETRNG